MLLYNNNKPIKPFPNGKIRFENRMYFFIEFDHIINTITSNRMDNCQTTVLCGFLTTLANLIKPWFSIGTVNVNRWMPFLFYPSWLLLLLLLCRAFSSHENKMWSSLYIMFYCKKKRTCTIELFHVYSLLASREVCAIDLREEFGFPTIVCLLFLRS